MSSEAILVKNLILPDMYGVQMAIQLWDDGVIRIFQDEEFVSLEEDTEIEALLEIIDMRKKLQSTLP